MQYVRIVPLIRLRRHISTSSCTESSHSSMNNCRDRVQFIAEPILMTTGKTNGQTRDLNIARHLNQLDQRWSIEVRGDSHGLDPVLCLSASQWSKRKWDVGKDNEKTSEARLVVQGCTDGEQL